MDKKCPHCGSNMPDEASFCLKCFSPIKITPIEITKKKEKKSNTLPIIIITFILILSVAITAIVNTNSDKSDNNLKNTVLSSQTVTNYVTQKATTISTTEQTTHITTTVPTTTKQATEKTTAATTGSTTIAETTKKATTSTTKTTTKKVITTTAPAEIVISGSTLTDYPSGRKSTSYTIPYSVTKISYNAFNGNKYLKALKFSKREKLDCNFQNLFSSLPNLETVYVYPGTDADLIGLQYFDGEIVYYD